MSVEWNIRLDTNKAEREIIKKLADKFFVDEFDEKNGHYSFRVPEALIIASNAEDFSYEGKRFLQDNYGVNLRVSVSFADYRGRISESEEDNRIGKGIATVLKEVEGDAVVLCNGEVTVAHRKNGELLVQRKEYEWLKAELDNAGVKYQKQVLASPFVE